MKVVRNCTNTQSIYNPLDLSKGTRGILKTNSKLYTFFKGRVALHAILKAAGIGPGDKVLLPGYTCVVVPNAILYIGAEPVFLDIDPNTYNLDPNALEVWLDTPQAEGTRAIVVQHTYGIPCDMDTILPLAKQNNLLVIEDSCHAIGSSYRGRQVGTLGDAAFFSSQWSKPLTTGLGGWATINDPDLSDKMDGILAEYPKPGLMESLVINFQYLAYIISYHPRLFWLIQGLYRKLGNLGLAIGSSSAMELSCEEPGDYMKAMGRIQVRQLEKLLAGIDKVIGQRRNHRVLIDNLLVAEGFRALDLPDEYDPVILRYPVQIKNKDMVLTEARRQQVQLGDWFLSPIHPNLDHWENAGYKKGTCPVAEAISATTINIPIGPRISEREIERTIRFLGQHAEPA